MRVPTVDSWCLSNEERDLAPSAADVAYCVEELPVLAPEFTIGINAARDDTGRSTTGCPRAAEVRAFT